MHRDPVVGDRLRIATARCFGSRFDAGTTVQVVKTDDRDTRHLGWWVKKVGDHDTPIGEDWWLGRPYNGQWSLLGDDLTQRTTEVTTFEMTFTGYAYLVVPKGEVLEDWVGIEVTKQYEDEIRRSLTTGSSTVRGMMIAKRYDKPIPEGDITYDGCEIEFVKE